MAKNEKLKMPENQNDVIRNVEKENIQRHKVAEEKMKAKIEEVTKNPEEAAKKAAEPKNAAKKEAKIDKIIAAPKSKQEKKLAEKVKADMEKSKLAKENKAKKKEKAQPKNTLNGTTESPCLTDMPSLALPSSTSVSTDVVCKSNSMMSPMMKWIGRKERGNSN